MGVYTDPDFFKVSTGYIKRVNDSWILFFTKLCLKKKPENKDWKKVYNCGNILYIYLYSHGGSLIMKH